MLQNVELVLAVARNRPSSGNWRSKITHATSGCLHAVVFTLLDGAQAK